MSVVGTGEMADLVRAYDWSSTEVGSIDSWSDALVAVVNLALSSPDPVALHLGAGLVQLYNDAFRWMIGEHHPRALGRSSSETWTETWSTLGPQFEEVMAGAPALKEDAFSLFIRRGGRSEEHFWNYTLSPIYEGGRVIGVHNLSVDVTATVLTMRALCETDEQLRLALSALEGVCLWKVDLKRDLTIGDAGFARLAGQDVARMAEGVPVDEVLATLDPEGALQVRDHFALSRETGRPYFLEHRMHPGDGRVVWVASRGRCLFDSAGEVEGVIGLLVDITKAKLGHDSEPESQLSGASSGLSLGNERLQLSSLEEARIVAADRVFGAVVVSFETGQSLLYPANVLMAASRHAIDLTEVEVLGG